VNLENDISSSSASLSPDPNSNPADLNEANSENPEAVSAKSSNPEKDSPTQSVRVVLSLYQLTMLSNNLFKRFYFMLK
jgi:hypothetical protein